jgi:glycosyltransferase involved in cell wall biosynthesis
LQRQTILAQRFEVLVASDAADPDPSATARATAAGPLEAQHVSATTPGAAAARNAGWRKASGGLILFLDDDVLPEPHLLEEHLAWHEGHPEDELGVLGLVRWARELKVTPFMRWLEQGIQFQFPRSAGDAGWGRFYTANASVKRRLLDRVDGFDEVAFPFHYEDLDLAYRMFKLGFRLLYNPRASAEHLHATTLEQYKTRIAGIAPAELRFVRKYPEVRPFYYDTFADAIRIPPARGRSARLARFVQKGVPLLGPLVWRSLDHSYKQALAPTFLEAWEAAGGGDHRPASESAAAETSAGSEPAGPK